MQMLRQHAGQRPFQQQRRRAAQRHATVRCAARAQVVVTREAGKNGKLIDALAAHGISCLELPLIEHAPGVDRDKLPGLLQQGGFDWVAVTSPEAAAVLIEGWEKAGKPQVRVAVVGGGTRDALLAAGVEPAFTASKAYGKIMGAELPHVEGGSDVVLYPASARASGDLQSSLEASGFSVNCIRTYDTVGVKAAEPGVLEAALAADVVTFGSPSAVKAWVALVGEERARATVAVCIGATSARACEAAGIGRVHYPDSPGIPEWVDKVREALEQGAPARR
ncbi:MAG: tetrapyrrole biosynthesis, uroporphyrinogen III synthase [Monoraphidium minutum]|nr:MAG: tetrapyrrole biosynthesis, uroporphyrinogen III synthase [Monoraphidium minutum]